MLIFSGILHIQNKEKEKTKLEITEWFVNFGKELRSKPHWVKIH